MKYLLSLNRGLIPACILALATAGISSTSAQNLGTADTYSALAATTITNTGGTLVTGDVGVSPGTAITGFPPGQIAEGAIHANDGPAVKAHADLATAYNAFAGLVSPPANNRTGTDLGGQTLTPGVYRFNTAAILSSQLTLDAQGDAAARFVIQIGTTLTTSSTSSVVLVNGANARNVFFQAGSSVTLGAGSRFVGNILAYTSVTAVSGSRITGRLMAVNGAVTLDTNELTRPLLRTAGSKADFDRDGDGDFVFENVQTGERTIWFLQNGQFKSGVSIGVVPVEWKIASAADFNADGYADIAWENSRTGEHTIWFLVNGQHTGSRSLNIVSTVWHLASAADFNGDGHADIAWENVNTGEHSIWFLKHGVHQSTVSLNFVSTVWTISGAADCNNNGHADVVWTNRKSGERSIWFLKNGLYQNGIGLGTVPLEWKIAGVADFNGNLHADLIWENVNSGDRVVWFLRHGVQQSSATVSATTTMAHKIAVH